MKTLAACLLVACGSAKAPTPPPPPASSWPVPDGWKSETIPFPLDFAPSLAHKGVEELRFAPGFMKADAPGYWAYAFVWRLEDTPAFDAATVAAELTTYFRGLVAAVDTKHEIADVSSISVRAQAGELADSELMLWAHVIDPFTTKKPVDLVGTASHIPCPRGAVWVFVLAPDPSPLMPEVAALARKAACDEPAR